MLPIVLSNDLGIASRKSPVKSSDGSFLKSLGHRTENPVLHRTENSVLQRTATTPRTHAYNKSIRSLSLKVVRIGGNMVHWSAPGRINDTVAAYWKCPEGFRSRRVIMLSYFVLSAMSIIHLTKSLGKLVHPFDGPINPSTVPSTR